MTTMVSNQLRKGPIMASLLIAAFVALLAQTVLNVALPQMMVDLDVGESTIQWLSNGYMLVNGVLVPISAYLINRFTTRKLFLVASVTFAIGTAACAVSNDFTWLLVGRLIQAGGAGILMPLMMIVIMTIFPVEERGKAMGMMGVAMIFARPSDRRCPAGSSKTTIGMSCSTLFCRWRYSAVVFGRLLDEGRHQDIAAEARRAQRRAVHARLRRAALRFQRSGNGRLGLERSHSVYSAVGALALLAFIVRSILTRGAAARDARLQVSDVLAHGADQCHYHDGAVFRTTCCRSSCRTFATSRRSNPACCCFRALS